MNTPDTYEVVVVVFAAFPDFAIAKASSSDGSHYSLTKHTAGIHASQLAVGQRLLCNVTTELPCVVSASLIP